jgi:hypothetical protein
MKPDNVKEILRNLNIATLQQAIQQSLDKHDQNYEIRKAALAKLTTRILHEGSLDDCIRVLELLDGNKETDFLNQLTKKITALEKKISDT